MAMQRVERLPAVTQITAMNLVYLYVPLRQFLDTVVASGVRQVELWGGSPHCYPDDAGPARLREIRDELQARSLVPVCFTPEQVIYPINIAAADPTARQRSIDYFLRSLDIAVALGAPRVLVTSGWSFRDEPHEAGWARSRDSLRAIAAAAAERDLRLSLEPLQPTESNLLIDLPGTVRMLQELGVDNVDVCLDTIPMTVAGETFDGWFAELGDRIAQVHLVDGAPTGHLAWGDGTLPLDAFLEALERHGYRGPLTLEVANSRYFPDPDSAMRRAIAAVRDAIVARGETAGRPGGDGAPSP